MGAAGWWRPQSWPPADQEKPDHPQCCGDHQAEPAEAERVDARPAHGDHPGRSIQFGTRSTATHTRIRLTLYNSSMTLPMSSEALSPRNSSGLVLTSCGPG